MGVATPGVVDPAGTVRSASHLEWDEVPLASLSGARLRLPVHVANDSHVAALAEYSLEFPEGESLVLVRVGEGVGAGIVLDGRLYRGPGSGAGEIGHVVVDADGLPCWCGRSGCLETVVAMRSLLAAASIELGRQATADDLALAAETVSAAGRSLGAALAHVVATLDVRHVALAGPVRAAGEAFRSAVAETIKMPRPPRHVGPGGCALGGTRRRSRPGRRIGDGARRRTRGGLAMTGTFVGVDVGGTTIEAVVVNGNGLAGRSKCLTSPAGFERSLPTSPAWWRRRCPMPAGRSPR